MAGDGGAVGTAAQRDQPHRLPADQPQLAGHSGGATRHRGLPARRGARSRALGLVPVDQSIDSLLDHGDGNAATILGTYPSYLARLVTAARRRGLGPDDFALRRIDVAGELLSQAVATAARDTFGVQPSDTFAMTEVLPVSGRTCGQGHLHLDLNMGLVEVIALDGGGPCRAR